MLECNTIVKLFQLSPVSKHMYILMNTTEKTKTQKHFVKEKGDLLFPFALRNTVLGEVSCLSVWSRKITVLCALPHVFGLQGRPLPCDTEKNLSSWLSWLQEGMSLDPAAGDTWCDRATGLARGPQPVSQSWWPCPQGPAPAMTVQKGSPIPHFVGPSLLLN